MSLAEEPPGMHPEEIPPGTDSPSSSPKMPTVWVWAIAVAVLVLLAYPVTRYFNRDASSNVGAQGGDQQTLLNQSVEHYRAGRYEEVIQTSQALLRINPNSADAYNNMAVAYLGLKKYDEAIRNVEQALRLNPQFQVAKNNLAWIQREQAKGDVKAAPATPNTPEYFVEQSLAHYQAGRYPDCIESAKQALLMRPDYAEAYNNIAAANVALGRWDEAIQNARQALRINPNFQVARNNLALAEAEQARSKNRGAK